MKDCINTTNNMTHVHEYEKNPYESLWLNDYESHDVNRSLLEFEKWSILSTQLDYVHYDKYKNSHFKLDARAPEERYNSKAYEKLKHSERILRD